MALDSRAGNDRAAVLGPALLLAGGVVLAISGAALLAWFAPLSYPQGITSRGARGGRGARLVPVQSKSAKDLGTGKVLIASRDLADENFAETAVLLVRYDEKSVVGLILNRRTDIPLSQLFRTLDAAKRRTDPVYLGGPVEESVVLALLRSRTALEGTEHVTGDLFVISSKARLEKTITEGAGSSVFHLYLGYAGWTNDQLQKEVEAGAWYIFQADAEMVFDSDPDSLWPRLIRRTEEKIAGTVRPQGAGSIGGFDPPFFISSYLAARPK